MLTNKKSSANVNGFIAKKLITSKQHVHKHGALDQEHTKVLVTPKTH